jgi:hypothetical protein
MILFHFLTFTPAYPLACISIYLNFSCGIGRGFTSMHAVLFRQVNFINSIPLILW